MLFSKDSKKPVEGDLMSVKNLENLKDIKAYMGEDTIFNGSLTFSGTVRVDGRMEGEVKTEDTLIVGETGILKADITAGNVICKGKIMGTIRAAQRVEIHANSEVVGNIVSPSLYVEVGALFDGQCDMSANESKIIKLVKEEGIEAGTSG
jgi:cytoskeletal protein CcmA (bactofilin family)